MKISTKQNLAKSALVAGAMLAPALTLAADYSTDYSTTNTAADNAAAAGVFAVFGSFILFFVILGVATLVYWIVMLIDLLNRTNWKDDSQRTTWLVVMIVSLVLGFGLIGAIAYHISVRRPLGAAKAAAKPTATK